MAERERRISTPLVLAAASGMLAVAAVAWLGSWSASPEPTLDDPLVVTLDDSTAERAAQSFYDAWRRRRWEQALDISIGATHREALLKQARDAQMPREERVVLERMWDALARAPLTLVLDEAEMPSEERTVLRGIAEYDFVNRPYRRRVEFVVERTDEGFRVSDMKLGEVLTELPPLFGGADVEEQP